MRSATMSVARKAVLPSLYNRSTVCVAPRLYTQQVRMNATATVDAPVPQAHAPQATTPAAATTPTTPVTPGVAPGTPFIRKRVLNTKESQTKPLIPGHVEGFPFPHASTFADRIKSGNFKGKLHIFAIDFETTGMTKRNLPRVVELSIEHLPADKLASLQGRPDAQTDKQISPQASCNLESPTANSNQFYSLVDAGIISSIEAYDYHQINRSFFRGKPTWTEVFNGVTKWLGQFTQSSEDLFVFLIPHFSTMEKVTLSNEFTRNNLTAPNNWTFVNGTAIIQRKLRLEKSTLGHIYSHLYGTPPQRIHRADADTKIVKESLAKLFTEPEQFKEAVLYEMAQDVPKPADAPAPKK